LERLAQIEGVYVPKFYEPIFDDERKFLSFKVYPPAPKRELGRESFSP
jgi:hypothetical protein